MTLVSIDLRAVFGMLKKPDVNDEIYLTYNMLHKPALQGILGAIAGYEGYPAQGRLSPDELPEYRYMLDTVKVAIRPLSSSNGNFMKEQITYNNGVGYASEDGNLIVNEQTLIRPAYRVFLELDEEQEAHRTLKAYLERGEAEFIPYLGKNEHQLWWDNYCEWHYEPFTPEQDTRIDSLFLKPEEPLKKGGSSGALTGGGVSGSYLYFEQLPVGWAETLPQYQLAEVAYTDFPLTPDNELPGKLVKASNGSTEYILQLF
jgi:CRISPR-associated protein Cas5h